MRDYKIYLKDIITAIEAIDAFVQNMDFEAFCKDDKTSSAVVRKLEIIGEASKQIPDTLRKDFDSIPWKEMAGMRDKLIHFYFGINYALVWKTVKVRLPEIKPLIEKMITE